jgi:hypothetical protein
MALNLLPLLRLLVGCQVPMILQPDSPILASANPFSAMCGRPKPSNHYNHQYRRKRVC